MHPRASTLGLALYASNTVTVDACRNAIYLLSMDKRGQARSEQWKDAGLAHPDSGVLRTLPLPLGQLTVPPHLDIDDQFLYWSWSDKVFLEHEPAKEFDVAADGHVLDDFRRISSADSILRFALRYGPLWLCERHAKPFTHPGTRAGCAVAEERRVYREPISKWLSLAVQTRALLTLAASAIEVTDSVRSGRPSFVEARRATVDKAIREAEFEVGPGVTLETIRDYDKNALPHLIAGKVNGWLRDCNVQPRFTWNRNFTLESKTVFGSVAALLMTNLSPREGNTAYCDYCKQPYKYGPGTERKRAPKAGQRNMCPSCHHNPLVRAKVERHNKRRQRAPSRADS
jgi:hypothetical protein